VRYERRQRQNPGRERRPTGRPQSPGNATRHGVHWIPSGEGRAASDCEVDLRDHRVKPTTCLLAGTAGLYGLREKASKLSFRAERGISPRVSSRQCKIPRRLGLLGMTGQLNQNSQIMVLQNSYRSANCMTRGLVSKPVYFPKDVTRSISGGFEVTLKRLELGTLKTSQRNCRE